MLGEYAKLYSQKEGGFSKELGTNLFNFLKNRAYKVRSVLDVACGTGEFVSVMRNGCTDILGIDFEPAMIDVAKKQVPDADFLVAGLFDFDLGRTFDLVSCNYETVNFALDREQLLKLFANVAKHLNKGGIFVFDFKTPNATDKDSFLFEESSDFDYVKEVVTENGEYVKREIFYVPTASNYHKVENQEKRREWSVADIEKALEEAGFVNTNLIDYNLNVLKKPKKEERVHVLTYKK